MNYEILDSVKVKRTEIRLITDGINFIVSKQVGEKVWILYISSKHELAFKFYERKIGAS